MPQTFSSRRPRQADRERGCLCPVWNGDEPARQPSPNRSFIQRLGRIDPYRRFVVLSDHERKTLRELERQFQVGPVTGFGTRRRAHQRRFADILALVTSVVSTATLLAVGSVGVALQPATATGPEAEALNRLHQLFVETRML